MIWSGASILDPFWYTFGVIFMFVRDSFFDAFRDCIFDDVYGFSIKNRRGLCIDALSFSQPFRDLLSTSIRYCILVALCFISIIGWLHFGRFGNPFGSMLVAFGTCSNPFLILLYHQHPSFWHPMPQSTYSQPLHSPVETALQLTHRRQSYKSLPHLQLFALDTNFRPVWPKHS